jgi:hypothetical protein
MKDYRLPQVASVSSIARHPIRWSVPDIEGDIGRPLIGNRNRMI